MAQGHATPGVLRCAAGSAGAGRLRPARRQRPPESSRQFCCAAMARIPIRSIRTRRASNEAMVVLRDLFEGLTRLDQQRGAGAGRRRELDDQRRRPCLHLQAAAQPALVERRSAGGRRFRRGPPAPGGSGHRLAIRAGDRRHPQRAAISSRARSPSTRSVSRRPMTHDRRDHPEHPGALSTGSHGASLDARRCIVRRSRNSVSASRAPGDQVSNGAFVLKRMAAGQLHPRRAQHALLEQRGQQASTA